MGVSKLPKWLVNPHARIIRTAYRSFLVAQGYSAQEIKRSIKSGKTIKL